MDDSLSIVSAISFLYKSHAEHVISFAKFCSTPGTTGSPFSSPLCEPNGGSYRLQSQPMATWSTSDWEEMGVTWEEWEAFGWDLFSAGAPSPLDMIEDGEIEI